MKRGKCLVVTVTDNNDINIVPSVRLTFDLLSVCHILPSTKKTNDSLLAKNIKISQKLLYNRQYNKQLLHKHSTKQLTVINVSFTYS